MNELLQVLPYSFRFILIAAILGGATRGEAQQSSLPYAQAPAPTRFKNAVEEARGLLYDFMARQGVPGLSVAVGVDGRMAWSEGLGYANVEYKIPVTPLTRFRSGSIAKPITAAGVGVLYERSLLDLDAPVRQYTPAFPKKEYAITTRQLAGHLAGIRHYPSDPVNNEYLNHHRYTSVTEALEVFKDDPLLFEPGTQYSYSSYGWVLISAVIEGASGTDYLTFMRENVFLPLGMRWTVAEHVDSIIPHRAGFYEISGDGPSHRTRQIGWESETPALLNAAYTDNSYKWAGGGLLTTPEDLVRFGSAHLQEGFLKRETLDLLFTPMTTDDGRTTGYGIGWRIGRDEILGQATVGHGGSSAGGSSTLLMYPQEKVVVAIQVNLTGASYGDLPARIARLFIADATRSTQPTF